MRTANVAPGLARAALCAAFASVALLSARGALASPTYPDDIQQDLGLSYKPACTICHDTNSGGTGTANKPFAKSMKAAGLTGGSNAASLKAALDKLKADKTDSDGDGTPDIDELIAGTDPNQAGGGGASTAAPDPTFGCVAQIAPLGAGGRRAWLPIAVAGAGLLAAAARRRRGEGAARRARWLVPLGGAGVLLAVACYQTSYVSSSVCSLGVEWTGGNQGSADMNPGLACIDCHSRSGTKFTIAGTVYSKANEADSCIGKQGATVVITGADGRSMAIETNEAGNFYIRDKIALPYRAMVMMGGKQNVMVQPQTSGDCNACHSSTGANAAPGRVLTP
jgi:hypothetical protein